jgi:hypothetical protein
MKSQSIIYKIVRPTPVGRIKITQSQQVKQWNSNFIAERKRKKLFVLSYVWISTHWSETCWI